MYDSTLSTITALDDFFGTPESILFIGGLVLLVATAVLAARDLVDRRGSAGVLAVAGVAAGLFAATSLVMAIGQSLVAGIAPGTNVGLEEEGGVLLAGAAWLAVALRAGLPRGGRVRSVTA